MKCLSRPLSQLVTTCVVLHASIAAAQPDPPPPPPTEEPAPAQAPSLSESLTGPAKASYEEGRILYGEGDFAGALVKFSAAHEQSKDPRLLWNMAVCEKNLRRYAKAQQLVERYIREGGSVLTDQDRIDAVALVQALKPYVTAVTVEVDQRGAEVSVDDEAVGTSPLAEPLRLNVGARRFKVSKPGFKDHIESRTIAGGTDARISVKLLPLVREGSVRVSADSDARIRIDGKLVGRGRYVGKLPSGTHFLRVEAPGKQPYDSDFVVEDDRTASLRVTLESDRPLRAAEGGGVPTWAWLVGSAVLAAGLGAGGYFLLKPEPETAPQPASGSMDPGRVHVQFWRR